MGAHRKKYVWMLWGILPKKAGRHTYAFKLFLINHALNYFRFSRYNLESCLFQSFIYGKSLETHQYHVARYQALTNRWSVW